MTFAAAQSASPARYARAITRGDEEVRRAGRTMALAAGEVAEIGQRKNQFAYVLDGATKLVARADSDREQIVGFQFAGDLVPLEARAEHSYALVALSDSALCVLDEAQILETTRAADPLVAAVLEGVLAALRRSREKTVALGRKTASEKIAGFLAAMAGRIGRCTEKGWEIQLPMSRRDIADNMGLTIETVSRQFTELRTEGLIETRGRSLVRVLDLAALASRAGHRACDAR